MTKPASYWGQRSRDRGFFLVLVAATGALLVLFSRFLFLMALAAVTVVVTWPLYQALLVRVHGRPAVAAVATATTLFVAGFGPLTILVVVFLRQASTVVQRGLAWVRDGGLTVEIETMRGTTVPWLEGWFGDQLGGGLDLDLTATLTGSVQSMALTALEAVGGSLPQVLQRLATLSIDALLFPFAVVTLYMEGPALLAVVKNLSPMEDSYDDRLMVVFRQFASNLVVGTFATAALQGLAAAIGYAIAGADLIVFLGISTAIGALIPLVGPALVWVPATVYVGATQGPKWGLFVLLWSLLVTGSIDNLVKPFFLRGDSNIHPLLIFLGVFGGLGWMGVPGAFLGPVLVAFFLALYTIYVRDFLGAPPVEGTA